MQPKQPAFDSDDLLLYLLGELPTDKADELELAIGKSESLANRLAEQAELLAITGQAIAVVAPATPLPSPVSKQERRFRWVGWATACVAAGILLAVGLLNRPDSANSRDTAANPAHAEQLAMAWMETHIPSETVLENETDLNSGATDDFPSEAMIVDSSDSLSSDSELGSEPPSWMLAALPAIDSALSTPDDSAGATDDI